ncbi:hypothetical protein N9N67_00855 [Bacteriovoracaceae bacterium]|nr:hypothetical protein [Bacteriovoracaceae bacterium]
MIPFKASIIFIFTLILFSNSLFAQGSTDYVLTHENINLTKEEILKTNFVQLYFPYVEQSPNGSTNLKLFNRLLISNQTPPDIVCSYLLKTKSKSILASSRQRNSSFLVAIIDKVKPSSIRFVDATHQVYDSVICDNAKASDFRTPISKSGDWERIVPFLSSKVWDEIKKDIIRKGNQPITIQGRITDSNSKMPLGEVKINYRTNNKNKTIYTDKNGFYSLKVLKKEKEVFIKINKRNPTYIGTQTKIKFSNIKEETIIKDISLKRAIKSPPLDGIVIDAQTGAPIKGIEVTYQIEGKSISITTNHMGKFNIPNPMNLSSKQLTIKDINGEYFSTTYEFNKNNLKIKIPILPVPFAKDKITIILTWDGLNNKVKDLDAYLSLNEHSFNKRITLNYATEQIDGHILDLDDRDFGVKAETITIPIRNNNTLEYDYFYDVHFYEDMFDRTDVNINDINIANPKVHVYFDGKLKKTFQFTRKRSQSLENNNWEVFRITKDGEIKTIDRISYRMKD